MISIVSSWFNVERMKFPWRDTLKNWVEFIGPGPGQIAIAVNTSDDNTANLVRDFAKGLIDPRNRITVDVVEISIPYTDPEFDGKGKAAAVAAATQPYVVLLDGDERIPTNQRHLWANLMGELERNRSIDGFMIPVVDLFGDERHYKKIGSKWYLTRNSPNITRGVWKGGYREDGTIAINRSDTCECIYADTRDLIRAPHLLMPGLPDFMTMSSLETGQVPFILHYGWINKEQRLRQSGFWGPIWSARSGSDVKTESTIEDLEKIRPIRHNLAPRGEGR